VSSPSSSTMYDPAVAASASADPTKVSPDPPFSLTKIWLNDPPLNAVPTLNTILSA
jgi:hypothetical protein